MLIHWSQYACINTGKGGCLKKRRFCSKDWRQYVRTKTQEYSKLEPQFIVLKMFQKSVPWRHSPSLFLDDKASALLEFLVHFM